MSAGGVLYAKYGAKLNMQMALACSIGATIVFNLIGDSPGLLPVVIFMMRLGMAQAYNLCFISCMELIPSQFSGTVLGYISVVARLCQVFSSPVAEMPSPVPMMTQLLLLILAFAFSSTLRDNRQSAKSLL